MLLDAGTRNFAVHADAYGRHSSDYFVPSYPYLFPPDPAPAFNGKQPNSGLHSEGRAVGGSYLFDGGYIGAASPRFTSVYRIPTLDGARPTPASTCSRQVHQQRRVSPANSRAIDVIRYWAGAVEYHHDELGFDDAGIDTSRASFKNHAQMPGPNEVHADDDPFGALIASLGTQFDHRSTPRVMPAACSTPPARTGARPISSMSSG